MSTFDTGRRAEAVAANFLQAKGCEIIAQNWRTRWCEIDIVAQRDTVIYFCEVKYRSTANQGAGLDYITPRKMEQMRLLPNRGRINIAGRTTTGFAPSKYPAPIFWLQ